MRTQHTKNITDSFDPAILQDMQDAFAALTTVPMAFVDPHGRGVTRPGAAALAAALAAPESTIRIREHLVRSGESGQPEIFICPGTGTLGVVPVVVDGVFLGGWLLGPLYDVVPSSDGGAHAEQVTALPGREELDRLFVFVRAMGGTATRLAREHKKLVGREHKLKNTVRRQARRDKMLTAYIEFCLKAVCVCDFSTGEILMVNEAFSKLVARPAGELVGAQCREALSAALPGFCASCPRAILLDENNQPAQTCTRDFYDQRHGMWLRSQHRVFFWNHARPVYVATFEDVTKEHAMREQLERRVYFHSLTGLPSKDKLGMDFEDAVRGNNTPERFMVCLDLSSLHLFSNAYGRETGNEMLKVIAAWFQDEDFGKSTLYHLSRYGFCLLLNSASPAQARRAALQISARFESPWQVTIGDQTISYLCDASVSILHIPPGIVSRRALIDLVSRTFDQGGKNPGIFVYDEEADRRNRKHIELVFQLKNCVAHGMQGFSIQYQPIVHLASSTWKGLEALCRWTMPDGESVSPLVFIHEAESRGLINLIGAWVLENAVIQVKSLGLDAIDGFFLSVNISPIQMMDETFADTVAHILERHDYPGGKLNLEVTESTRMTFSGFTMSMIEKMRALGIRLALDDFGTGYSSFSSLKHLPVDFLKTERDFILDIETDTHMQYFFYIMSEIAHANKMALIAEGVETAEQLKIVKNNGADYIQGYLFSKPLSPEALAHFLPRFTCPDHLIIPDTTEVLNITQWLSGKNAYELTPALFSLLSRCLQVMLSEADVAVALQNVLEIVGRHFGASRAFAFVEEDPGIYSNLYEWCARDVPSHKQFLQKIPVLRNTPSLLEAFKKDGMVIASHLGSLPEDMRDVLRERDVNALILLPMWEKQTLAGFVGFDKTIQHSWSPEEAVILWNLSMIIANTMKREKLQVKMLEKKNLLDTVLQNPGLIVCVTDCETDAILWANQALKANFKCDDDIIGRKCFDVVAGRESRCPNCEIDETLENKSGKRAHEVCNERLQREYMAYANLIQWTGDKKARIHYFMDVTEQKKAQKQLMHISSTDLLTGALNRTTTLEKMRDLLRKAHTKDAPLAVCLVSIDRLGHINKTYGHEAGDQILARMVQAIKGRLRSPDVIGRYGGNKFIVLLPGCPGEVARLRMLQVRNSMARAHFAGGRSVSLRFGIVENRDLPYADSALFCGELLTIAEKQLQEQSMIKTSGQQPAKLLTPEWLSEVRAK